MHIRTPATPATVSAHHRFGLFRRLFETFAVTTVLVVLSGTHRASASEPWPELPLPPKAAVQWVAQSMRVNGVPTRIMQFQSRASRTEIVAYYQSYWSGGYPHPATVHPLGEATVVGQKHGPFLLTLKVEDAPHGASTGLLAVAQVGGAKPDLDPGQLPMMGGAHVISVIESDDPGKHSRQVVILAPQPPSSVSDFYEAALTNEGWQQVQGGAGMSREGRPASGFAAFAREGNELQVSITQAPGGRGSTLVANLVTKDTGPDED